MWRAAAVTERAKKVDKSPCSLPSAIQSVTILYTISNNTQQCHTIYNNIDKILSILYNIVVYCLILYLLKIRHNIVFKYCLILYTIPNNKLNKICYNIIQYLWLILFLNIVQYFQILFDIVWSFTIQYNIVYNFVWWILQYCLVLFGFGCWLQYWTILFINIVRFCLLYCYILYCPGWDRTILQQFL